MPHKPSLAALLFEAKRTSYEAERVAKLRRKGLVELETYAEAAIAEVRAVRAYHLALEAA